MRALPGALISFSKPARVSHAQEIHNPTLASGYNAETVDRSDAILTMLGC
jgi:hypothetical protein